MKKPNRTLTIGAAVLAVGVLSATQSARAQQAFGTGNLVVNQVGTGSAALTNASTAVSLHEYTILGASVQSIGLATNGTSVTQSGTATSEGLLHFAADGSSLLIPGYNVATGVASVASTTSTAAPRAIAEFSLNGTQTSVTQLGSAFSANNIRAATGLNAGTLFAVGANTGVVTATAGTNGSTTIFSTSNSLRDVNIFGGNTYLTSTSSGAAGLFEISGTPTTIGQTATLVGGPTSPVGFSVSSDNLTAYVVSGTTLTKYTRAADGNTFTAAYTATVASGVTGLTVSYGTTNTVYFDNPSTIFSAADSGSSFGTINTLATAATNTAFRGLDIVPVPEPATVFGGLLLVCALGWNQRRRLGGLVGQWRTA